MANAASHNESVHTVGDLPKVGTVAPESSVVKNDLTEVELSDFRGKKIVLNISPSIDTGVYVASAREFHTEVLKLNNMATLCISKDLPFTLTRFRMARDIGNLVTLPDSRGGSEQHYPIVFADSPLKGLLSRSMVVIDENGKVVYTEQVTETTEEPNYAKALEAIK